MKDLYGKVSDVKDELLGELLVTLDYRIAAIMGVETSDVEVTIMEDAIGVTVGDVEFDLTDKSPRIPSHPNDEVFYDMGPPSEFLRVVNAVTHLV